MTDWRLKIFAYLHDPPDKPLALGRDEGHAAWGRELAARLGAAPTPEEQDCWEALVARADRLAAGADRSALLPRQEVVIDELRHPLSGRAIELDEARLDLRDEKLREVARQALGEEFAELAKRTAGDAQAAFLGLWGVLPARLRSRRGPRELRGAWDLLPAETRMPNHPVPAHQALVAALTTVLAAGDTAAVLSFSVGPVQRFIAQARRASDLWAGSVILAQAILAAAQPLAEELGPDHVVFPALRSSRTFLAWLVKRSRWQARLQALWPGDDLPDPEQLGSLPNRLLAIVPAARAREFGERCEHCVRSWWERFVLDQARWLEDHTSELPGYVAMAGAQADGHLRITWAASPWPLVETLSEGPEAVRVAAWGRGGRLPEPVERYVQIIAGARTAPGGGSKPFQPNGGLLYSACYESVERLAAAVKRAPRHVPRAEGGLKCSLCGERAVVGSAIQFAEQRERWRRLREGLERGAETRGLLRRGEALCGVCWAKRRFGFEARGQGVPSTAEIAAAPFKARLLETLDRDEGSAALRGAAQALVRAVQHDGREAFVVPALRRWKSVPGLLGELARVPGEVLLAYPREDREPDAEPVSPGVIRAASELRAAAERCGIPPPRPYLAVLVLDGDEMGRWLSGAKAQPLRCYLSDRTRQELESQFREWSLEELLSLPWPMTPALHGAFSEACGVFSQRTARRTVEDEALGVLVYAGGDDVLALVPIGPGPNTPEQASEIARRLRFRFSGHVRRPARGGGDEVHPAREVGFVLDQQGVGLAFGGRATASAGIAVFHHRWPLGRALEAARVAEEYAKEVLGRDALGLTILRRSGQTTQTGLGFRLRRGPVAGLMELGLPIVKGAVERHAEGAAPATQEQIWKAIEVLAGAVRKADGNLLDAAPDSGGDGVADPVRAFQELCQAFGGPLSPRLVGEIGQRLGSLTGIPAFGATSDQPGRDEQGPEAEQLGRWLGLIEAAAFLARGGAE